MHHDEQQLDALWKVLKSGDAAAIEAAIAPYRNSQMPGVVPLISLDDECAEILSIPRPDRVGKHVYGRRPGGKWMELT